MALVVPSSVPPALPRDDALVEAASLALVDKLVKDFVLREFHVELSGTYQSETFSLCAFVCPEDMQGRADKSWREPASSLAVSVAVAPLACDKCGEVAATKNLLKSHEKACKVK